MPDLQGHQTAYSQDRGRPESEPDPDRDIELELCALDLEDSDHQDITVQVGTVGHVLCFSVNNVCLSPLLRLSGVSRLDHPTVSGCFPPPPASLLLSPSRFSCGGAPPNGGSFDRKDRRAPAEKDGVQVNNHEPVVFFASMTWLVLPLSHSLLPLLLSSRKSIPPGGLVSGGLGVGKLVLRAGPPRLVDACPEAPVTEMLLNGS